jgi:glyoxylase-like metal-dependent hydrolase (beta-lactamase superfamily II)
MVGKPVIEGVHVVPMGFSNAFLIEGDGGLTLIDAGFPDKEAAVFGAIRRLGCSPDQLKHLIFTHGHPDHIGSAATIVRETGARTYMHPRPVRGRSLKVAHLAETCRKSYVASHLLQQFFAARSAVSIVC